MIITQQQADYEPVTITFDKRSEAEALRDIVDSFDNVGQAPSNEAWELICKISDAFTDCKITY